MNRSRQPSAPEWLVPESQPGNEREAAVATLIQHYRTDQFAADIIDRSLPPGADSRQRAFCQELVYGVVRRRDTLDTFIASQCRRSQEQVEPSLWVVLRAGVYQLVAMDRVPDHAAISETVEICRWMNRPRWTGFVNSVLRRVQDTLTADFATHSAANHVPVSDGRYRVLKQPLFPDPSVDQAGYVSAGFSYPRWLIERWGQRFSPEQLISVAEWLNSNSPPSIRVNPLRCDRETALNTLQAAGVAAEPGHLPCSIILPDLKSAAVSDLLQQGMASVQDETAMSAVRLLDPQPGQRVLDLCAAPGSKSTHLAEVMGDSGVIDAVDSNARRLRRLRENIDRMQLSSIHPHVINAIQDELPARDYDAILLDAPCSNTGVMSKRPEVRWRLNPSDIEELAALQRKLFAAAVSVLRSGGRLVYSTCSIEPEENEAIVAWAETEFPALRVVSRQPFVPGQPSDGGFQALFGLE